MILFIEFDGMIYKSATHDFYALICSAVTLVCCITAYTLNYFVCIYSYNAMLNFNHACVRTLRLQCKSTHVSLAYITISMITAKLIRFYY